MLNESSFADLTAKDIMTKNPKLIQSTDMVVDALNILEDFSITGSCRQWRIQRCFCMTF
jgi:arabinose-5-phosphate isomerase